MVSGKNRGAANLAGPCPPSARRAPVAAETTGRAGSRARDEAMAKVWVTYVWGDYQSMTAINATFITTWADDRGGASGEALYAASFGP
jgi:hypothetical protein